MIIIQYLIILLSYQTIAQCELYLLHLEKSISSSLYHGITTTYKKQLTNQRTSIHTIILEYSIYSYSMFEFKLIIHQKVDNNKKQFKICILFNYMFYR